MNKHHNIYVSLFTGICAVALASCRHGVQAYTAGPDLPPRAVVQDGVAITLRDQKLTLFQGGQKVKDYDISSSKFGIGTKTGSHRTPTGIHAVAKKVGEGQPSGMVFKACRPTGEVVPVDANGRDPVVTRIIQIAGLENPNSNSFHRRIYIHGTPEERLIGTPASYGCIRMRSSDVVDLFSRVHRGMPVAIETCSQKKYLEAEGSLSARHIIIPQEVVAKLPTDTIRFRPSRKLSRRSMASRSRGKTYASHRTASTKKLKSKSTRSAPKLAKTNKGKKLASSRRKS